VWIAPGVHHAVNALEDAAFCTLYIHADVLSAGWLTCRMLGQAPSAFRR